MSTDGYLWTGEKHLGLCHSEMVTGDGKSGQRATALSHRASTSNSGQVEGQDNCLPRNCVV